MVTHPAIKRVGFTQYRALLQYILTVNTRTNLKIQINAVFVDGLYVDIVLS